jgi:sirohydrochlorin ferrochelatase
METNRSEETRFREPVGPDPRRVDAEGESGEKSGWRTSKNGQDNRSRRQADFEAEEFRRSPRIIPTRHLRQDRTDDALRYGHDLTECKRSGEIDWLATVTAKGTESAGSCRSVELVAELEERSDGKRMERKREENSVS